MKIDETTTASAGELGKLLGVTARRVRQLHEEGTFERSSRGQYPLAQCIQAYVASIEAATDPEELKRERVELMKAQRKRIEQDLTERQATALELDEQDQLIAGLCLEAQGWMRQIPSWLAGEGLPDVALRVEQWVVGIRAKLETDLRGIAAKARQQRRKLVDWSDLRELSGGRD